MTMGVSTIRRPRAGFTLVELLVTIAIIAILASFILGALYGSQEKAKETRTEALVAQLHNVIIDKWEGYRTRRLPVATGTTPANRLVALRKLMRMELPDRYKDLEFDPTSTTPSIVVPSQRNAYRRKIEVMRQRFNTKTGSTDNLNQYLTRIQTNNQSAECLYLIITVGLDADERAVFKARDMGDTDTDGMPELLDGWGNPIEWLRWAPGFVSDLQPLNPSTSLPDSLENHDAFDPLRLQRDVSPGEKNWPPTTTTYSPPGGKPADLPPAWGFNLVPLIVSPGPDGNAGYGLYFLPEAAVDATTLDKDNNPYSRYLDTTGAWRWRGEADTSNGEVHLDNIHNHLIGTR